MNRFWFNSLLAILVMTCTLHGNQCYAGRSPGFDRTAMEAAQLHKDDIDQKLFVITGAYSGIGVETTRALLSQGGKVVVGGRSSKQQTEFLDKMKKEFPESEIEGFHLDLTSLASVKRFANSVNTKYRKIDVLINNAGIMNRPAALTLNGVESHMGINVVGHFLLSKLLARKTKRQVWVSSQAHEWYGSGRIDLEAIQKFSPESDDYDGLFFYQQSKLGNILLAKEFGRRYRTMQTCSLHPGVINTNLLKHLSLVGTVKFLSYLIKNERKTMEDGKVRFKKVTNGAATTVTAASLPSRELVNGGYYEDCEIGIESEAGKNRNDAKALFQYCDKLTRSFQ